jgi:hypothetical protein
MAGKKILQQKYLKPPCIKYTKMYTCKCRVLLAIDVDHYLNSVSVFVDGVICNQY